MIKRYRDWRYERELTLQWRRDRERCEAAMAAVIPLELRQYSMSHILGEVYAETKIPRDQIAVVANMLLARSGRGGCRLDEAIANYVNRLDQYRTGQRKICGRCHGR